MFCSCFQKIFSVISVRPIISTSTGPIFTKFAGLVDLWLWKRTEVILFRFLEGRCRVNQFCGQNRPPNSLYTMSKKQDKTFLAEVCQMLTDFQICFTVRLSSTFVIKSYLNVPPYLKHVATLPCEISLFKKSPCSRSN